MIIKRLISLTILGIIVSFVNGYSVMAVTDYPSMIVTSLGEDASTQAHVSWHTLGDYTQMEFTVISDVTYSQSVSIDSNSELFEYLDFNLIERTLCRVDLNGLTPGQGYRYRIGNGETWTPSYTFTTADLSDEFSFIFISDSQASTAEQFLELNRVVRLAMQRDPHASFIFSGGDQVDVGGEPDQFKYFFEAFPQLMYIPLMTLHGNHEAMNAGTNWREEKGEVAAHNAHFYYPQNGHPDWLNTSYYFRYNHMLFIALNTQLVESDLRNQADWLESVLLENEQNNLSQYVVIGMHRGVYGNYYYGNSTLNLMNSIYRPLFDKYNVDLVLSGHDHTYSRSHRLYQNNAVDDYSNLGTIYLIGGATGPKLSYDSKEAASHLWNLNVARIGVYTIIKFTPTKIIVQAYNALDVLIDEFYMPTKRPQSTSLFHEVFFEPNLQGGTLKFEASTLENVEAISIENIDGTVYGTVDAGINQIQIDLHQLNATLRLRLRLHYTNQTTRFETFTVQTRSAFETIEKDDESIQIGWNQIYELGQVSYYEVYLDGEKIDTLHPLMKSYHLINLQSDTQYTVTLHRYDHAGTLLSTESRNIRTS